MHAQKIRRWGGGQHEDVRRLIEVAAMIAGLPKDNRPFVVAAYPWSTHRPTNKTYCYFWRKGALSNRQQRLTRFLNLFVLPHFTIVKNAIRSTKWERFHFPVMKKICRAELPCQHPPLTGHDLAAASRDLRQLLLTKAKLSAEAATAEMRLLSGHDAG